MKVCVVILVLYLLISEQVLAQSSKSAKAAKSATCPADLACDKLQGGDCTVTVEDFEDNIVNKDWLVINVVAFPPVPELGKVKIRWTQSQSGGTVTRQTLIPSTVACLEPIVFNLTIADNTDCGIELNEVNNGPRINKLCSQNTTEYVVSYECADENEEGCTEWYSILIVPENRDVCVETPSTNCSLDHVGEPDLTNLPWEKINQDWFKFICAYFPDAPFPDYIWTNKECDL